MLRTFLVSNCEIELLSVTSEELYNYMLIFWTCINLCREKVTTYISHPFITGTSLITYTRLPCDLLLLPVNKKW